VAERAVAAERSPSRTSGTPFKQRAELEQEVEVHETGTLAWMEQPIGLYCKNYARSYIN
jgi:hypothetical protein